jgi:hypothetical protein
MKYLIDIFKNHRWSLLKIYFYMLLAHSVFLCEPYILGKMIDGLLHQNYNWLYIFLGVEVFANFFIYRRMVFDTKVYTTIYNKMMMEYIKNDKTSNCSSTIARTDMGQQVVNFLENDIQYLIMSFVSIVGALFFILTNNFLTGVLLVSSFIPISFIVFIFYKKIAKSTRVGNSHYEDKVTIFTSGDIDNIETFLKRRKKIITFKSTLQAKNWVSLNVVKTIFLVGALFLYTHNNVNLTQGQTLAIYAYINQFLISLMSIPIAVEIYSRIKDIIKRLQI